MSRSRLPFDGEPVLRAAGLEGEAVDIFLGIECVECDDPATGLHYYDAVGDLTLIGDMWEPSMGPADQVAAAPPQPVLIPGHAAGRLPADRPQVQCPENAAAPSGPHPGMMSASAPGKEGAARSCAQIGQTVGRLAPTRTWHGAGELTPVSWTTYSTISTTADRFRTSTRWQLRRHAAAEEDWHG